MMRFVKEEHKNNPIDKRDLAEVASSLSQHGIDDYSDYGVGAAVQVSFTHENEEGVQDEELRYVYGGFNINFSGMEYKLHAEQFALFQAIIDWKCSGMGWEDSGEHYWDMEVERVMVHTTEEDLALVCGHCLQVLSSWDDEMDYIACRGQETYDDRGNPDGVAWSFREQKLSELLPTTYTQKRDGD